jgi:hypothetical protein
MRRFLAGAAAITISLVVATPVTAAKSSNPDCVADDVQIIRNAFGADDIGPLFRTAAQRGWMAAMMHDFRANGCA